MFSHRVVLFLLSTAAVAVVNGEISRQECLAQGGEVIGDTGDGAIFRPNYRCDSNGMAPIDTVAASAGEPMATEGEVCCGPAEDSVAPGDEDVGAPGEEDVASPGDGEVVEEDPAAGGGGGPNAGDDAEADPTDAPADEGLTEAECAAMGGTPLKKKCDKKVEALGTIQGDDMVCCPAEEVAETDEEVGGDFEPAERDEVTRQECVELGGQIVGDIGDGAILQEDYLCEVDGEPPVANVVPLDDEPTAVEGEVCCGTASNTTGTMATTETMSPTDDDLGNSTMFPSAEGGDTTGPDGNGSSMLGDGSPSNLGVSAFVGGVATMLCMAMLL